MALGIKIKFLFGNKNSPASFPQAMDLFLMPSLFEGVPVVGVEAQFSGLPCVFSDKVPKEIKFTENVSFISLKSELNEWVTEIFRLRDLNIKREKDELKDSIFNIENAKTNLENIYLNLEKNRR